MTFTAQLLAVTDAFLAAPTSEGLSESTLSWRAFGETKVLRRLASGEQSITLIRADRALCWLSANWPADAAWPDGVERPDPESDCGARTPENSDAGFTTAEGLAGLTGPQGRMAAAPDGARPRSEPQR